MKTVLLLELMFLGICSATTSPKLSSPLDTEEQSSNDLYKGTYFEPAFYSKAHDYMVKSRTFSNYSLSGTTKLIDEIQELSPLKEIVEKVPYYMAGYDFDERPIWVMEMGKYNLRGIFTNYTNASVEVEQIWQKACINIFRSMYSDVHKDEVKQYVAIVDFDGLDMLQVTHLPTATFILNTVRKYLDFFVEGLHQVFCINTNFAAETLTNLARPLAGRILERVEIFGTNRVKWLSVLRRHFPDEALPPWYGGHEDWKPVEVYG